MTVEAMLSPERTARISRKVRLMAKRDDAIGRLVKARARERRLADVLRAQPLNDGAKMALILASSRVDRLYCRARNYARLARFAGKVR